MCSLRIKRIQPKECSQLAYTGSIYISINSHRTSDENTPWQVIYQRLRTTSVRSGLFRAEKRRRSFTNTCFHFYLCSTRGSSAGEFIQDWEGMAGELSFWGSCLGYMERKFWKQCDFIQIIISITWRMLVFIWGNFTVYYKVNRWNSNFHRYKYMISVHGIMLTDFCCTGSTKCAVSKSEWCTSGIAIPFLSQGTRGKWRMFDCISNTVVLRGLLLWNVEAKAKLTSSYSMGIT